MVCARGDAQATSCRPVAESMRQVAFSSFAPAPVKRTAADLPVLSKALTAGTLLRLTEQVEPHLR